MSSSLVTGALLLFLARGAHGDCSACLVNNAAAFGGDTSVTAHAWCYTTGQCMDISTSIFTSCPDYTFDFDTCECRPDVYISCDECATLSHMGCICERAALFCVARAPQPRDGRPQTAAPVSRAHRRGRERQRVSVGLVQARSALAEHALHELHVEARPLRPRLGLLAHGHAGDGAVQRARRNTRLHPSLRPHYLSCVVPHTTLSFRGAQLLGLAVNFTSTTQPTDWYWAQCALTGPTTAGLSLGALALLCCAITGGCGLCYRRRRRLVYVRQIEQPIMIGQPVQ
eukprot:4544430-Prymnesium_polylepis.1